jgi:putative endonuclease
MKHNQRVGRWGEQAAAAFLLQRGYVITAQNFRTPYGEIDLIARQGELTIFIEVKTRTSNTMGLPEDSITPRKRQHMIAAAEYYAAASEIDHWQIDVISIEGRPGAEPKITYFENAVT